MLEQKKHIKQMVYQYNAKRELLFNDIYKGYHFYILNLGTHPTAYVEIPKNSKLFCQHHNRVNIDVHGGLTYSDNELLISDRTLMANSWFIGWDYAHAGDYMGYYKKFKSLGLNSFESINNKKWTTEEIIEECKNAINQIINLESQV